MLKTAEPIEDYRATLGAIGLVVVIGALLRFYDLGSDSLWLDEAVSWTEAKNSLADLVWRSADEFVPHPPLFNLSLFAAIKLFGDSEWDLRLPSAIFGVANILALYPNAIFSKPHLVGRKLYNHPGLSGNSLPSSFIAFDLLRQLWVVVALGSVILFI
jgi:uncharacterized membrane protein